MDLVFYHRILRCFVIDAVRASPHPSLGYVANEENIEYDNPPTGIILSLHKDELLLEYATYQMNSQLFVQKYQLYLSEREELCRELELTLREAEQ